MTTFLLRFVSLLVFTATITIAQTAPNSTGQSKPTVTTETLLLRAQLDTVKEFDQRLLSTVQWSLGIVVASLAVLVGYNWYTNHRELEKDKAALKEDLGRGLKDLEDKLQQVMRANLVDAEKRLQEAGTAATETLREEVNRRFFDQDMEELLKTAEEWEAKDVPANGILYRLRILQKLGPHAHDRTIGVHLAKIKDLLKVIKPQQLTASKTIEITEFLGTLSPKFDVEKTAILEVLRNLRK